MLSCSTIHKTISQTISQVRGTSLKAKSARAVMTLGVGTVTERGLRLVRNMILARLLAPDQFGLMAIIMVTSEAFEAFTEVGVKQSVIRNKLGADPKYLNVVWWFQAIRVLGLFMIAFLAAPWISSFYDNPELLNLLRVAFTTILFRGFISPRAYVLEKEYRFGLVVLLARGSGILSTFTTIILAFIIQNVWALVIGFVAEFAIMCLFSYVLVPFRPTFNIHRESLRDLFKFARGMFGLPILTLIALRTDVFVLGKVVTGEELGMYYLAAAFVQLPIFIFKRVVTPVLLPAFSQKQDNKKSIYRAVLLVTKVIATFSIPLVAFMACCADALLHLGYGQKYIAVTFPCALLCLLILTRTQGSIFTSLYFAMGQPNLRRYFVAFQVVIIVSLIYPAAVYFGPLGAAIVLVVSNYTTLLMQVLRCRRIIDLEFDRYIRSYVPGLLLASPIVITISLLRLFGIESPVIILVFGFLVFGAAIIAGMFILGRSVLTSEESANAQRQAHQDRSQGDQPFPLRDISGGGSATGPLSGNP